MPCRASWRRRTSAARRPGWHSLPARTATGRRHSVGRGRNWRRSVPGALASSGPKNTRPTPMSTKCSAMAMISSASTEASATGRKAKRQISGPIGVTIASASRIETAGCCQRRKQPGGERQYERIDAPGDRATPRVRVDSEASSASADMPSSSHSVPGTWPDCSVAAVSAPNASRSPCGTKMTRVTENVISNPIAEQQIDRAGGHAVLQQREEDERVHAARAVGLLDSPPGAVLALRPAPRRAGILAVMVGGRHRVDAADADESWVFSSASRKATRNASVPGLPAFSASGIAAFSSSIAS